MLNDNEMWKKIYRQTELQNELLETFSEYDFLISVSELKKFVTLALHRLNKVINGIENFSEDELGKTYIEFKYDIFSAFSLSLTIVSCLYEESKQIGLDDEVHPLVDSFKKSGIVNIFNVIRNRMQHGAILNGEFSYQFTTHHHEDGEKATAAFNVYDSQWEKVREECNQLGKSTFDSAVAVSSNKVVSVFENYLSAFEALEKNIENEFRKKFHSQMASREDILKEIQEIESWLNNEGIYKLDNFKDEK